MASIPCIIIYKWQCTLILCLFPFTRITLQHHCHGKQYAWRYAINLCGQQSYIQVLACTSVTIVHCSSCPHSNQFKMASYHVDVWIIFFLFFFLYYPLLILACFINQLLPLDAFVSIQDVTLPFRTLMISSWRYLQFWKFYCHVWI